MNVEWSAIARVCRIISHLCCPPIGMSGGSLSCQNLLVFVLQASVLDTLTDAVLTACASAPLEVRLRLLGVVDRGATAGATAAHKQWQAMLSQRQQEQQEQQRAASTADDSSSAPMQEPQQGQQHSQDGQHSQQLQQASSSAGRFSQLCIRKLFVLCSRGTDATGANRCLLEVAQLTLPLLLDRCGSIHLHALADSGHHHCMSIAVRQKHHVCLFCHVNASITVQPSSRSHSLMQSIHLV